jgi:hypothetical protein
MKPKYESWLRKLILVSLVVVRACPCTGWRRDETSRFHVKDALTLIEPMLSAENVLVRHPEYDGQPDFVFDGAGAQSHFQTVCGVSLPAASDR